MRVGAQIRIIQVTNAEGSITISLWLTMKNGKPQDATDLESELLRLNSLVRARRKQLARLEKCPNKDCPCRVVWRNHVEKDLAGQVRKIRRQVGAKRPKSIKARPRPQRQRSR